MFQWIYIEEFVTGQFDLLCVKHQKVINEHKVSQTNRFPHFPEPPVEG